MIFLTAAHPVNFKLGRCVAEDSRECSVEGFKTKIIQKKGRMYVDYVCYFVIEVRTTKKLYN